MSTLTNPVFTVGQSTHPIEAFLALLTQHGVTALADVRSTPYSRTNPQFNRETLERHLKEHGIKYVFLGAELGARSNDLTCYEHGRVQYARLARTDSFRAGIDRVIRGTNEYRIALMCARKNRWIVTELFLSLGRFPTSAWSYSTFLQTAAWNLTTLRWRDY